MAQIKIDFDALRSEASKMGSMLGTYEGLTKKLKSLSEQILSQWEGEASTSYGNKMEDYHRQALIMIFNFSLLYKAIQITAAPRTTAKPHDADFYRVRKP